MLQRKWVQDSCQETPHQKMCLYCQSPNSPFSQMVDFIYPVNGYFDNHYGQNIIWDGTG